MPGFLLKIRPDSARIFTKMSPDEELVTLDIVVRVENNNNRMLVGSESEKIEGQLLIS